ncbi:Glycosyl transferase family 2 [Maribacter sedimenticola]|uniref:Glycosyl transferase family 2 n=1 Tax=Maribacter sedimenticola TaxID=228956 RepID=A0ABY1SJW8_9FLAO|nr:glycosyltransferase family 2 protein [Maribacter sedimenticola]SNR66961.1 Glycosyl transferase family 2 [Maribacter sedimenticola]
MISIIIPLYNKEQSIEKTISSVLCQSYTNFELLIVDDGSTDKSVAVVNGITDERIRLIEKDNGGVSSTRNTGVHAAKYEWISFLDADDVWHIDFLKNIVEVIEEQKEVQVITTDYETRTSNGDVIKSYVAHKKGYVDFFAVSNEIGFHILNMSAFCVRKSTLIQTGLFSTCISHGEDMEVFEKLARKHKIYLIDKVLSYYIQDAENRASYNLPNPKKTRVYQVDTIEILSRHEEKYQKDRILVYLHEYFVQGKLKYLLQLYTKHSNFVSMGDITSYVFKRLRFKVLKN